MSVAQALYTLRDNPAVKAHLPMQVAIVEMLLQRAEGKIPGWSAFDRRLEACAALRENGKLRLLGGSEEQCFDFEVRGVRAVAELFAQPIDEAEVANTLLRLLPPVKS